MEPIAERTFEIVDGGQIRLRVFKPQQQPTGEFGCEFELEWPRRKFRRTTIYGVDGLQALQLALSIAFVELEVSPEGKANRITWCDGPDLGLPKPGNWDAPPQQTED